MPLPTLLTSADYDVIRGAIRSDIGAAEMPDVIVGTAFSPATAQVVAVDTLAGTWTAGSDQETRAHDAAVLLAAAYLVGVMPQVVRESFQGYSYALQPFDPMERASYLRSLAYELLALNLAEDVPSLLLPASMALAPGGRGDIDDLRHSVGKDSIVEVWP